MRSRNFAGRQGRPLMTVLVAAALSMLVLAGCAAGPEGGATAGSRSQSSVPAASAAAAGGGAPVHSSPSTVSAAGAEGAPSASAKMVCGDETRANVTRILSLSAPLRTTDAWADKLYTCTYALPTGALVLSVKEAADPAAARGYFDGLQRTSSSARPVEGMANLGLPAFESTAGAVVFVKDSFILTVDAAALPVTLGPHGVTRGAFAYELATAVLACWSE